MAEQERTPPELTPIELRINFVGGEDVPVVFASNLFVRHLEDVFLISFAQLREDYRLQLTEQDVEDLRQRGLDAKVMVRLAVPPSKMKEFIEVLSTNFKQWEQRFSRKEEEHGASEASKPS